MPGLSAFDNYFNRPTAFNLNSKSCKRGNHDTRCFQWDSSSLWSATAETQSTGGEETADESTTEDATNEESMQEQA
jgi:hypothetical protein